MNRTRKILMAASISVLIVFFIGVGFVMFVGACGFDSFPGDRFQSRFHRGPFHDGPFHEDMRDFMMWRLDKGVKKLDLTESQNQEYQTLKGYIETTFEDMIQQKLKMRTLVHDELGTQTPDLIVITDQVQVQIETVSKTLLQGIDLLENFYNSLDDDQKKIIADAVKERAAQHCRGSETTITKD